MGRRKKERGLIIKVFDIDYSFILKNYLDPKLWKKEWTLFVYKYWQITIKLSAIYIKNNEVSFMITVKDTNPDNTCWSKTESSTFDYQLDINNIDILKNGINSVAFKQILWLEKRCYIEESEEYRKIINMQDKENEKLTKIAEEFLDDNNVLNEEIREAYIDYFVDKNNKTDELLNDYVNSQRYKVLTELFIAFTNAIKDKELKDIVKKSLTSDMYENTLKEIEEYEEYMNSDEYEGDMASNLEEI